MCRPFCSSHSTATPGPAYFGESVNIEALDAQLVLDVLAHVFGPGFRTVDACAQLELALSIP